MLASTDLRRLAESNGEKFAPGDRVGVRGAVVKSRAVNRDNRLIKGIVTTTDVDEEGEVILAQKFDRSYFPDRVKTVYIDHKYDSLTGAVGVCRHLAARGNGLFSVTYITERPIGEDLLTAVEEEVISGLSIGFAVHEAGPPTSEEKALYGDARGVIRKGKLLEYSFTANPCNPMASIVPDDVKSGLDALVTKGKILRSSAVAFGLREAERRVVPAGKSWRLTDDGDVVVR
ncbi:MAG: hypothetical protein DWQ20_00665 [Actinobacteria bacterium]|nr:MAG: hypothetical protein DWQ20_00665 [Actinomycetota bacterium]